MNQRPNILYIFTDQQSASAMRCAGNADVDTPAMDRLAATGVRFSRAYCSFPLCTPSRLSMLTGRMPHEMECVGNRIDPDRVDTSRSLGRLLGQAGYRCAWAGKWHVGPGECQTDTEQGFGFEAVAPFGDAGLADAAAGFLRQDHDRPFFLAVSFDNPHNICEWARHQPLPWGDVPPAPIDHCPDLPANFSDDPYFPQALALERGRHHMMHPGTDMSPDWWRQYRHAYFRLVEKVDTQIGRILDALDHAGLADTTTVIFSSDHGDMQGAHRLNQKRCLYEESVAVPLIVRPAKAAEATTCADRVSDRLVSIGQDLLPSVCDFADVPVPEGLAGRSWRPLIASDAAEPWRDHLVLETHFKSDDGWSGGTMGRAVITDRHKYVLYHWGAWREQLFDRVNDTGEMVNLALNARHADLIASFRQRLGTWGLSTGDTRFARCIPRI